MQAIISKYLPATESPSHKPARITARCKRGSITIGYPHEFSGDECHVYAVEQLISKFCVEDLKCNGTPIKKNPWRARRVVGTLPSGERVHVYLS